MIPLDLLVRATVRSGGLGLDAESSQYRVPNLHGIETADGRGEFPLYLRVSGKIVIAFLIRSELNFLTNLQRPKIRDVSSSCILHG